MMQRCKESEEKTIKMLVRCLEKHDIEQARVHPPEEGTRFIFLKYRDGTSVCFSVNDSKNLTEVVLIYYVAETFSVLPPFPPKVTKLYLKNASQRGF